MQTDRCTLYFGQIYSSRMCTDADHAQCNTLMHALLCTDIIIIILFWYESVATVTHAMGWGDSKLAEVLEVLLGSAGEDEDILPSTWVQLPLFEDIARNESEVQLHSAATMVQTSVTMRLVPKDWQR